MKNFIVYNNKGKILRTGYCPANMVSIQAHDDEIVMEGQANDEYNKIVGGKVVRKSDEEIAVIEESKKEDPEERLIQNKMNEILREMAIEELMLEGRIEKVNDG